MTAVLLFLAIGQVLDVATFSVVYHEYPLIVIAEVFPLVPLTVALAGIAGLWVAKGALTAGVSFLYPRARKKARWADWAFVFIAVSGYVGAFSNVVAYLTLRSLS